MMNHSLYIHTMFMHGIFDSVWSWSRIISYKLQVDPIKDYYFVPFQYHLTEIFYPISDQAFWSCFSNHFDPERVSSYLIPLLDQNWSFSSHIWSCLSKSVVTLTARSMTTPSPEEGVSYYFHFYLFIYFFFVKLPQRMGLRLNGSWS